MSTQSFDNLTNERSRPPAFLFAPGSRPLEGYTIKRGLGHGGFGEAYFAVSDAGKEVALKLVRRNLEVELRGVTQCLNLKHPNLIGLYDVRVDADGNHWIVMEYVAGRRLVDVLAEHPHGLSIDEALRWFRGIAAGTAYLHDNGIVHRDLKPANLFIENDVVKLGDYGLAKFISVSRRSGQTESVGTVHYMAPEIANGRYGKQIDIYALGIILYELLTGRVPFEGESVGEILMKHLTAEPDLSAVPEALRPAVEAALRKDPADRPQTVAEFVAIVDGRVPPPAASSAPHVALAGRSPTAAGAAVAPSASLKHVGTVVALTVAAALASIYLLRTAAAYDGSMQPVYGWGIAAVWAAWSVAVVVYARRRGPQTAAGGIRWGLVVLGFIVGVTLVSLVAYESVHVERQQTTVAAQRARTEAIHRDFEAAERAGFDAPRPDEPAESSTTPAPAVVMTYPRTFFATVISLAAFVVVFRSRERLRSMCGRLLDLPERDFTSNATSRFSLSIRSTWTEIIGSLTVAGVAAVVVGRLMLVFRSRSPEFEEVLWLVVTIAVGAIALLIAETLQRRHRIDAWRSRGLQAVVALSVGLASWSAADYLAVSFDRNDDLPRFVQPAQWPECFEGMQPRMSAHLIYFALTYFVIAWWRQTDRRRPHRVQFGEIVTAVLWAVAAYLFLPFPQPYGIMAVGGISAVAQLAAPWGAVPGSRSASMPVRGGA